MTMRTGTANFMDGAKTGDGAAEKIDCAPKLID